MVTGQAMEIRSSLHQCVKIGHFYRFIIDKPFPEYYLNENILEAISKMASIEKIEISFQYHLLVETPETNLRRSIQWIKVSYTTNFK
jgi:hypothetical protein